jgi:HlyD family secretion protein
MPEPYSHPITPRQRERQKPYLGILPGLLLLISINSGCTETPKDYFQGYVEGDFVQVASPLSGRLEQLPVQRGARVVAGDLLFVLEREGEAAAVKEAEKDWRQALDRLADLTKGQRPTELRAIRARLERSRTARELSRQEWERRRKLYSDRFISEEELDQAATALRRDEAEVAEIEAELATARLGARKDQIEATRSEADAARARLEQARWSLEQKSQRAPTEALIFDTLFEQGDFVPQGRPVVSLLPPRNIKIRFFVPEPLVGTLMVGQQVAVSFDGDERSYGAAIVFISPEAEFTPPVIFSRQTRSKLVFMVEARPEAGLAGKFHPGQPVDVRLEGKSDG